MTADASRSAGTAPPAPDGREPYRIDPDGGSPHAANARLLGRCPVTAVELPGGVAGAAVLGHEALREFLGHPDVAKDARHFADLRAGRIPRGWPLATFATVRGMTTADGADHRRLRSLVTRALTVRRMEGLRPGVEELTETLLDGVQRAAGEAGDGVVDLRRLFALPLPMGVICDLLGVDAAHADRLHDLSNQVVATRIAPEDAVAANREMVQLLGEVVAERRRRPGPDLTSALVAAREEDGDRLDEHELIGTLLLMVVAGHETTLNLISNAVRALCAHPDQLAHVRGGRASWADAVEETLRYDSPVSYFPFRYPVRDVTVGGTTIPAGTPVLAGYSAAGRDPAVHGPDADRFDVLRGTGEPAARHLSFGHGPHFCLGAPLARMEASVALERLYARFPDLELAVPDDALPRHAGFVGNGVSALPVRPGPARTAT